MAEKTRTSRAGRPNLDVNDELLKKVEKEAAKGLTQAAIAQSLGIGRTTLFNQKKKNVDFLNAIKKGQAKAIGKVENALFKEAVKGGSIAAMIFYLKNRCPDEWKDKQEVEATINTDFASRLAEAFKRDQNLDKQRRRKTSRSDNK
ncbi:MAG: hypothetical protein LPD71_00070 [Shewanella sp.]|nr:hypothetical protein [Shewanella sp.]MCF1437197.1 hypothetical protein [Shewanella sp.]MCF1459489.1 hypothetical protein [Shewanella sp.]